MNSWFGTWPPVCFFSCSPTSVCFSSCSPTSEVALDSCSSRLVAGKCGRGDRERHGLERTRRLVRLPEPYDRHAATELRIISHGLMCCEACGWMSTSRLLMG
ncbi:hypothetical protein CONLIGDRAFT_121419 [Coniochaeta ligniaria NRRL 30616]|uniref:Uncharacterized protein n=1 Tax=Coniochaeta ligniaria NRRL 30616 TaxID=1408157 RepID=A0A1J7ISD9_9PEZI|nr:hypothetical protein CONLIGDRAFT_121419 [Coniochaeta ligniaria NRRL 30616]